MCSGTTGITSFRSYTHTPYSHLTAHTHILHTLYSHSTPTHHTHPHNPHSHTTPTLTAHTYRPATYLLFPLHLVRTVLSLQKMIQFPEVNNLPSLIQKAEKGRDTPGNGKEMNWYSSQEQGVNKQECKPAVVTDLSGRYAQATTLALVCSCSPRTGYGATSSICLNLNAQLYSCAPFRGEDQIITSLTINTASFYHSHTLITPSCVS